MCYSFKRQKTQNGTVINFLLLKFMIFIMNSSKYHKIISVHFILHRIYAEVIHIKNEFNHVLQGETGPQYGFNRDPKLLADFLKVFYDEAKVSPEAVEYVEGFGSGKTKFSFYYYIKMSYNVCLTVLVVNRI